MTNNYLAATSMVGQILYSGQPSTTSETAVYTVPSNTTIKIASASLCNTSGSSVTVNISVVPSGGTADTTHRIISAFPLAAGDTASLKEYVEGVMMGPGDFISVAVGTASTVDVVITGTVVS